MPPLVSKSEGDHSQYLSDLPAKSCSSHGPMHLYTTLGRGVVCAVVPAGTASHAVKSN